MKALFFFIASSYSAIVVCTNVLVVLVYHTYKKKTVLSFSLLNVLKLIFFDFHLQSGVLILILILILIFKVLIFKVVKVKKNKGGGVVF